MDAAAAVSLCSHELGDRHLAAAGASDNRAEGWTFASLHYYTIEFSKESTGWVEDGGQRLPRLLRSSDSQPACFLCCKASRTLFMLRS
jgi:hypothetical protein